jgi:two-component system chemotaxis response regulator CheB
MNHDIIVIGASAGGVEALTNLVADLSRDLPASVFVVQHVPPWHRSQLPEILTRAGHLPAVHPYAEQSIEKGRIYVAPPDQHLILQQGGTIGLWHGPKENRLRPAVNSLFRSAAVTFGPRVAGVVLSGMLDDGAAGLWWIKKFGGTALVQDPLDAQFPDMPRNAIQHAPVDIVLPLAEIGPTLNRLAGGDPSYTIHFKGAHLRDEAERNSD